MSALPALVACPAWAARWDVHPTISSDVTYSDNIGLTSSGAQKSDWVTQVTPGISVSGTGAQLKVNATYNAQILRRMESGNGGVNHQFSGAGNAELVKQLFFVDAGGTVGQQNVSLLGPQAQSNVNNTGNRATVRSFSVSPYLRHDFGLIAQAEARLTHGTVSTSSVAGGALTTGYGKSNSDGLSVRVSSGPAFKLYTWNVAYSKSSVESNLQPSVTTETVTAGGRRLITGQMYVTSSVGYEKSDYSAVGNSPSGSFWNLGLEWTPTPRTRFGASFGKRYFGNNNSFDFSHRTRLTTWGASYSENVTTTHSQALAPASVTTAGYLDTLFLASVPDPAARQLAVESFIAQNALPASLTVPLNFLTTQTSLVKRWQGSFGVHGVRNTVLTNVFRQNSEALAVSTSVATPGDFSTSSIVQQTGGSVLWNMRLGTLSSANLNATYTRSEYSTLGRTDNLKLLSLGVNRQFQPKLFGSLGYRGTRSDSTTPGAGYAENAVTAALSYRY